MNYNLEKLKILRSSSDSDVSYEAGLPSYTSWFPPYRWLLKIRLNTIINKLPKGKDKSALDFGCGSGILLPELVKRYDNVCGVDLDTTLSNKYLKMCNIDSVKLICNKEGCA